MGTIAGRAPPCGGGSAAVGWRSCGDSGTEVLSPPFFHEPIHTGFFDLPPLFLGAEKPYSVRALNTTCTT